MKRCGKCHTELPEEEFYKNKAQRDGLQSECKLCTSSRSRSKTIQKEDTAARLDNKRSGKFVEIAWQKFAKCAGIGYELFHPNPGEYEKIKEAKSYCQKCPVSQECLEYAISTETPNMADGIWGGLMPQERNYIRQKDAI